MKWAWLLVAACGENSAPSPDAACVPGVLYLDRTGGAWDKAAVDDPARNKSVLLDGPRTLPAWPHDDIEWADEAQCIRDTLAPFAITVTETDPGEVPHVELVFTTSYWLDPATTHVLPDDCRPNHAVAFVFGNAIATDARTCQLALQAFAQMTAGLSLVDNCRDVLDQNMDCVPMRMFVDETRPCTGGACRCGGTEQNGFAALQGRFPRCD